jgi:hypothetical protein
VAGGGAGCVRGTGRGRGAAGVRSVGRAGAGCTATDARRALATGRTVGFAATGVAARTCGRCVERTGFAGAAGCTRGVLNVVGS